eukprot:gene51287-62720_t
MLVAAQHGDETGLPDAHPAVGNFLACAVLAREEGKALPDASGEVLRAAHIFKFFAGEALRMSGEALASVRPNMQALRVGPALEAGSQMGPVASDAQLQSNLRYVALARAEGCTVI